MLGILHVLVSYDPLHEVVPVYLAPYTRLVPFLSGSNKPCKTNESTKSVSGWARVNAIGHNHRKKYPQGLSVFHLDISYETFQPVFESLQKHFSHAASDILIIDNLSLVGALDRGILRDLGAFDNLTTRFIFFEDTKQHGPYYTCHYRGSKKYLVFTTNNRFGDTNRFLEEVIQPVVLSMKPDFVLLNLYYSDESNLTWYFDSPIVDVCAFIGRNTINRFCGRNHTFNIYFNPFMSTALFFTWNFRRKKLFQFDTLILEDQYMQRYSTELRNERSSKHLEIIETELHTASSSVAFSNTSVNPMNTEDSFCNIMECRLGNFLADAILSLVHTEPSVSVDFSLIDSKSLRNGWYRGEVYRYQLLNAYHAAGNLFYTSMSGADLWYCLEESLRLSNSPENPHFAWNFLQISHQGRYAFQRYAKAPWVKLVSFDIIESNSTKWIPIKRDHFYQLVTTANVLNYFSNENVQWTKSITSTVQESVVRHVNDINGILNVTLEGRIRDYSALQAQHPTLRIMKQCECGVNTRWNRSKRICEACEYGYYQPEGGQEKCLKKHMHLIPNRYSIPTIALAMAFILLFVILIFIFRIYAFSLTETKKIFNIAESLPGIIKIHPFNDTSDGLDVKISQKMKQALQKVSAFLKLKSLMSIEIFDEIGIPEVNGHFDFISSGLVETNENIDAFVLWIKSVGNESILKNKRKCYNVVFLRKCFHMLSKKYKTRVVHLHTDFSVIVIRHGGENNKLSHASLFENIWHHLAHFYEIKSLGISAFIVFANLGHIRTHQNHHIIQLTATIHRLLDLMKKNEQLQGISPWFMKNIQISSEYGKELLTRINGCDYMMPSEGKFSSCTFEIESLRSEKVIIVSLADAQANSVVNRICNVTECLSKKSNESVQNAEKRHSRKVDNLGLIDIEYENASYTSRSITVVDQEKSVWTVSNKLLGEGSFAKVFLGMSPQGNFIAVKTIEASKNLYDTQSILSRERIIGRLLSEVFLLRKLRHPNIVGYLNSFVVDNRLMLMMEFVSGGTLQQIIENFAPLRMEVIRKYVRECLLALVFLHEKGIIHGDIKPQNILVSSEGECKLADFGSSVFIHEITSTGPAFGSPFFMSPEACRGNLEKASDIWSIGILTYFLLTKQFPFDQSHGCDIHRFLYLLGSNVDFLPRITDRNFCHTVRDFILMALHKNPADRPTASELLESAFLSNIQI